MRFQAVAQHPRPAWQEHIFDVPEKWCNCCDINFWMWMNVEESGFEWSCLAKGHLALQARDWETPSGRLPTQICRGSYQSCGAKGFRWWSPIGHICFALIAVVLPSLVASDFDGSAPDSCSWPGASRGFVFPTLQRLKVNPPSTKIFQVHVLAPKFSLE